VPYLCPKLRVALVVLSAVALGCKNPLRGRWRRRRRGTPISG
jgi:hypothetical protein